jgi:hypothetical protein
MFSTSVTVELQGGLGNQLFGWAAGFVLSQKLGCDLIVDRTNLYQRGYQLDQFSFSKNLQSQFRGIRKVKQKFYKNIFEEEGFEYDPRFENIVTPKTLRGYFQSWKYHTTLENEIYSQVRDLIFESSQLQSIRRKYDFENLIGIHVRRGDYKNLEQYHGTMKTNYYRTALEAIGSIERATNRFIVFSDEPEEAKSIVPGAVAYIGPTDLTSPAENMVLMSGCRALIGANSSFSLWAGLIMEPESKLRIFPTPWFAEKSLSDKDLVPQNFLRLQHS